MLQEEKKGYITSLTIIFLGNFKLLAQDNPISTEFNLEFRGEKLRLRS